LNHDLSYKTKKKRKEPDPPLMIVTLYPGRVMQFPLTKEFYGAFKEWADKYLDEVEALK